MAPSRPDMIFPGCPTCGNDVKSTDLAEGVLARSHTGDLTHCPARDVPTGWTVERGDPDGDELTLHPCEHVLFGDAAYLFNLAALNLTHPDLVVEVRVIIPAAANYPDRRQPRIVTKTGTYSAAGFADQVDADRYIADRIHDAGDAVVKMLGLIGVTPERAERLNAAVFEALGAASTCWQGGTGDAVFESERCSDIGRDLLTKLGIPIAPNYRERVGSTCDGTGCTCAAAAATAGQS